jgi:hypothetical protein
VVGVAGAVRHPSSPAGPPGAIEPLPSGGAGFAGVAATGDGVPLVLVSGDVEVPPPPHPANVTAAASTSPTVVEIIRRTSPSCATRLTGA